jgi:hypothetical protein
MTGIPSSFDTSFAPEQACKTFRRQVETIPPTSLGGVFKPGEIVKLPIATGTPDAWNDQKLMYLEFVLTITNTNPFIDYVDFSEAGAASVIEQLVVNANNVPFETLQDYNTLYTHLMRQKYPSMTKAYFFIPRVDPSRMENNKIKLPMVDSRTGQVMGNNISQWFVTSGPYFQFANREKCPVFGSSILSGAYHALDQINPYYIPDNIPAVKVDYCANWEQETFKFLANAKCIPIGCTSNANTLTCYNQQKGYIYDSTRPTYSTPTITNGTFTYQVSLPIYSATVGANCPYPFPTFLADQLSLEITLARPAKIFQVSMDPVRRIPGTMRDFVVNNGDANMTPNVSIQNGIVSNPTTVYFPPFQTAGIDSNVNLMNGNAIGTVVTNTNNYPFNATTPMGITNLLLDEYQITVPNNGTPTLVQISSFGVEKVFANYDANTYVEYPTIYSPSFPQSMSTYLQSTANNLDFPNMQQTMNRTNTDFRRGPFAEYFLPNAALVPWAYYMQSPTTWTTVNSSAFIPFMEVGTSYTIPMGTCDTGCYGTYEAYSVPQVHRTLENCYWANGLPNYTQQTNEPTYQLTNVILKQTQIILPSDINKQIIEKVRTNGTVSMYFDGCELVDTFINKQSPTQDIILPINYLQANTIQFLFRPSVYLDNSPQSFYYNSLRGVCPFTSITYDKSSVYRGKGTNSAWVINSQPVDGQMGAATAQLRIGEEYLPVTPLKGIQEMANSTQKCSGDPNISNYLITAPILCNNVYDITCDEQYTTTYISTDLIGDQTLNYIQEWGMFNWCNQNTYAPSAATITNATFAGLPAIMEGITSTTSFPYNSTTYPQCCSFLPYSYQNSTLGYAVTNTLTGSGSATPMYAFNYPIQAISPGTFNISWNCLPYYTTPSSTFLLGFNLQLHPYDTGRLNSGRFLGNSNIILSLTNAKLAEIEFLRVTMITTFEKRLDIRAGGTMFGFQ